MAKRLAELGALQDAVSNSESNPSRLGLAGYIRGLFLDWSANPYNPLTRLSARGRLLGYFWDNGAVGLSMDFANQSFIVKDGTLQSKPFSDIVNFSRTSNATVTNSAGVITYAPHNLLTYSEQFDNAAWTKTGSTITANNIVAPNGTTTADKLVETAVTSGHNVQVATTLAATTYTVSVYAKKAENNYLWIRVDALTFNKWVYFNLDLGTTYTTDTGITYSISPSSNGFYRCSVTWAVTTAGTGTVYYGTTDTEGVVSYLGDGTSGIYIWGAQLEIGSTATTYNSTTVKNLLGFSELFDNAAWTKSNSFVQTNLLTYSEAFDNAAWAAFTATVSANQTTAPNKYLTADKVTISGSDILRNNSAITVTTATTYTQSFYLKKNDFDWVRLVAADTTTSTNAVRVWFNLNTGSVGSNAVVGTGWSYVSSSITNVGNGWYRCSISFTTTGTAYYAIVTSADADASLTRATSGSSYFIWGAQLVQGSVAGDYRRTDAAALPVYYPNHNGVVCAEQLNGTAANATILESYTATGSSMTFSVWMRRITGTGNVDITMDTGVTWTTQSITTSWARYSVTSTPASGARTAGIRLVTSGDIIQVFGAQVSDSASLDPYVLNAAAAPSAAAYYGARFDYDPVTLAPKGLLIEEQRANLLLNSSLAGTNLATQSVTVTAVAHTLSFYGTGTVTLTGTANTSLVGTGAYPTRSTLTFTPTAGVVLFTVTGTVQYAQLEIGSFATSFIPTAASQVTRTADVATIQGSNFYSWYNQNEGSIYSNADTYLVPPTTNSYIYGITDGTVNNTYISYVNLTGTEIRYIISYVGPAQSTIVSSGITSNTFFKHAAAYKINDVAGVLNNGTVGIDTSVNTPIVTKIILGSGDTANRSLNGHIKQISYYPQRLSNDVLKGLTA